MKDFYKKAEPIYRLAEKESKSPNKFAQANAKNLTEFLEFAQKCYIKMQKLQEQLIVAHKLHDSLASELLQNENEKEKELVKEMWAKHQSNPAIKEGLKQWANVIIEQQKIVASWKEAHLRDGQ